MNNYLHNVFIDTCFLSMDCYKKKVFELYQRALYNSVKGQFIYRRTQKNHRNNK